MDSVEFHEELERRLAVVEDPGYSDPAAAELPARDWLFLAAGSLVLIVALMVWGYPW